ncbi:hypothetical protein AKJ43_01655 [candidate division MSBL1 archaeon SCGC-AAA261D19]|uniref:DUF488 domain-containing protein n=1 Tax=candidate division MSBL1 archaeon SCGC-AAA261D19 TaxID=1698273 RepID=A0A133V7U5_9EURY|nr:hypothetical protein AKJ43_01655 [candidate division MSBL1 archaeon SCGC-AAA261D19]
MGFSIKEIYTVGYGDKKLKRLIKLLKREGVRRIVDVRSFPKSKWSDFTKESLQWSLPQRDIDYVHLQELGGFRNKGYKGYMESDDFREGLNKLMNLARERKTAIMCLESYPGGCHRRYIAKKLGELGWKVIHLVGKNGKRQSL